MRATAIRPHRATALVEYKPSGVTIGHSKDVHDLYVKTENNSSQVIFKLKILWDSEQIVNSHLSSEPGCQFQKQRYS